MLKLRSGVFRRTGAAVALIAAVGVLCEARQARAYNEDLHYNATFAIAAAVGFGWRRSWVIASADESVDHNLFTKPTEHAAWKPKLSAREARQFELIPGFLSLGLSLQDYFFHCFSPFKDERGHRHKSVLDNLSQLERRAHLHIDEYLLSRSDVNEAKALVAIGLYLHCQQDSWSHSGYGGNPLGHILDSNADEMAEAPSLTQRALRETIEKLKQFRSRIEVDDSDRVTPQEFGQLLRGLTEGLVPDRKPCTNKLIEYWFQRMLEIHPLLRNNDYPQDTPITTYRIGPNIYETTWEFKNGVHVHKRTVAEGFFISRACQDNLLRTFPHIEDANVYTRETMHDVLIETEWSEPVILTFMKIPSPQLLTLQVDLSVNPLFDNSKMELWKEKDK